MASKSNWIILFLLSFSTEHDQMAAKNIITSHNQIGSKLTLIPVQKAWSGSNIWANSCLTARVKTLKFEVWWHEEVDELGIGSSTGTTCVNVRSDIMDLFAVLFDDNGSSSCSGISSKDNTLTELDPDDGCSCLFVWQWLNRLVFLEKFVSNSG
jgi:hypothetical protein